MKIVSIVGARPQFVKASVVSRALGKHPALHEVMIHTGQHYDGNMSDVFFEELGLPAPAHFLGIGSGGHGQQTGRMLERVEAVLASERPDLVLVYGDTNSTLAGALAAAKMGIPVAHVEAGLRSYNRAMPEEINRVLTDHLAEQLFAPTETAVANLRREGIREDRIRLVGDVMYDVSRSFGEIAERRSRIVSRLGVAVERFALATIHRAENTDDPTRLRDILRALDAVGRELEVVFPLHPRTRDRLGGEMERLVDRSRVRVIDPVGYLDMIQLEKNARVILTDSGGVQKEAYFFGVPCVTLRAETEWVELLASGWNVLWPPTADATTLLEIIRSFKAMPPSERPSLFGNGTAAEAIAVHLADAA